jgi:hypothetical protein
MKEPSMKITTSHDVLLDLTSTIGRLENELLAATLRIDNDARMIESLTQERDAAVAEPAKIELQEPVAWYEYNADLDAWFISYGHNPRAKTRPLVFGDEPGVNPFKKGWVMVPIEPTPHMTSAFSQGNKSALLSGLDHCEGFYVGYKAMLASVPKESS